MEPDFSSFIFKVEFVNLSLFYHLSVPQKLCEVVLCLPL